MFKKYTIAILVIVFSACPTFLWAQGEEAFTDFNRAGKTIYNFLRVEQGARPVALGGAFTAIADDINSIFYNPAGLVHVESTEYMFSYADWLVDSKFFSGAFAYRSNFGTFGVSFVHFGINEFEETTPLQPEGTGRMVGAGDLALGLAYSREITDKLSLGGHVRYIQETLDEDTRSSVAFDIGTFYNIGFRNLKLGVTLRNLGPDQAVSKVTLSESFPMPIDFNVTLASDILGSRGGDYCLTVAVENGFTIDLGDRYRAGAELWLANIIAIRGGYRFNYSNQDFSLGAGVAPVFMGKKINIDVAYTHFNDYFDAPIRISLGGAL